MIVASNFDQRSSHPARYVTLNYDRQDHRIPGTNEHSDISCNLHGQACFYLINQNSKSVTVWKYIHHIIEIKYDVFACVLSLFTTK